MRLYETSVSAAVLELIVKRGRALVGAQSLTIVPRESDELILRTRARL